MYKLEISIPHIPPALNRTLRMHYHKRHKIYQEWYGMMRSKIKEKPSKPLELYTLTITRCYYRQLDFDGLVGSYKPVADALKMHNVILDDRYCCSGPWVVTQEFRSKNLKGLTKIMVEER